MSRRFLYVAIIAGSILIITSCDRDPTSNEETSTDRIAALVTAGAGPFLLETPDTEDPDAPDGWGQGCAVGVNNEGFAAGTVDLPPFREVVMWGRDGSIVWTTDGWGGYAEALAIDDRGQVLIRNPELDPRFEQEYFQPSHLPTRYMQFGSPTVWLGNRGDMMANYSIDPGDEDRPFLPYYHIGVYYAGSGFKVLEGPPDPARRQPHWTRTPQAECSGEAIDVYGRVYGKCSVNGKGYTYRWTTNGVPIRFGSAETGLDFRIADVNRYAEIIGTDNSGAAVYWSATTGKVVIPLPPGVSRLTPVAINDRGIVLLSSSYVWGEWKIMASTIATWNRSRGTLLIDKGPWQMAAANDINNQGIVAGCVTNDPQTEMKPALWRIAG